MKKALSIILIAALVALALTACGGASRPERLLAGRWDASVGGLFEFQAMEFVPEEGNPRRGQVNLSLVSNIISGSYVVEPPEQRGEPAGLRITYRLGMISTTREFSFTVDETALTMHGEGIGGVTITYTRAK